jgi:hypothetical protein
MAGQQSLAVAKNRTVLFIREWSSLEDQLVSFLAFAGHLRDQQAWLGLHLLRGARLHHIGANHQNKTHQQEEPALTGHGLLCHPHEYTFQEHPGLPENSKALVCIKCDKNASDCPKNRQRQFVHFERM